MTIRCQIEINTEDVLFLKTRDPINHHKMVHRIVVGVARRQGSTVEQDGGYMIVSHKVVEKSVLINTKINLILYESR